MNGDSRGFDNQGIYVVIISRKGVETLNNG